MRFGLILLLCLLNTGCALWRKDREEPVENGPRQQKAEPVLKPSEVLKPKSLEIASPISDLFYMRGTYFQGAVDTVIRVDSSGATTPDGTVVSGEDDLGLDDVVDMARMEFDVRMGERNHLLIDYFKLDRFGDVVLPRDMNFGDFSFQAGDNFRSKIDWHMLGLTYTYSLFRSERFEAGVGLGLHIIEAKAEGNEPGTLNIVKDSEAGPFPTIAVNGAYRISKRWSVTARGQTFTANRDESQGTLSDYHADVQYRWKKNFAIGIGYSSIHVDLDVADPDQSFLFQMDASGPELFFRAAF